MRDEKELWGLMFEVHSRGRDLKKESMSVLSRRVSFSESQKQNVLDRFRLIFGQNRDKSFHFVWLDNKIFVSCDSFKCKNSCTRAVKTLRFIPNKLLFLSDPITALPSVYGTFTIRTAFFPWIFDKSSWIWERPRRVGLFSNTLTSSNQIRFVLSYLNRSSIIVPSNGNFSSSSD